MLVEVGWLWILVDLRVWGLIDASNELQNHRSTVFRNTRLE